MPTWLQVDLEGLVTWLATFALVTYLALSGGGYDIVARSQIGLLLWWFVLLGVIVGVLPRRPLSRGTWAAFGLLAGFAAWSWIATSWSGSEELTSAEVARVFTYLGVLVLGACVLTRKSAPAMLNGLTCAIAFVSALAVLSRLAPSLFPGNPTSSFYAVARLSYPFDYADGVGEFAALGLPLLLWASSGARTLLGRAAAAAGLPLVLFCLALTVSRGGILAAAVGVAMFVALAPDRLPKLATIALAAVATAVLMAALLTRHALFHEYLASAPSSQRASMGLILVLVLAVTAFLHGALQVATRRISRPRWLRISRRGAQVIAAAIAALAAALVIVAFAGGVVHHLWDQFKQPNPPATAGGEYLRLLSVAGSHRYQYWQAAISAFDTAPWKGIGPGTYQFWWAAHNTLSEFVRNAHSLWIETLAETGIIGAALIFSFFLFSLIAGSVRALRAEAGLRLQITAAVAGVGAFCAAAAFDWVWQIGVMPMIAMLLVAIAVSADSEAAPADEPASALASAHERSAENGPAEPRSAENGPAEPHFEAAPTGHVAVAARPPHWRTRIVVGLGALVSLWAILVPLSTTVAGRASQSAAVRGDLRAALSDAADAQQIDPDAASPRLQRALVLEQLGDVSGASQAIAAAVSREPANWALWLVASRIATEADMPRVALADYRRARALNPTSPIFRG
jgi:hypothetical protein